MHSEKLNFLTAAFNRAENYKPKGGDFLDQKWARIKSEKEHSKPQLTGVSEELLYKIGNAYTKVPPGLHVRNSTSQKALSSLSRLHPPLQRRDLSSTLLIPILFLPTPLPLLKKKRTHTYVTINRCIRC